MIFTSLLTTLALTGAPLITAPQIITGTLATTTAQSGASAGKSAGLSRTVQVDLKDVSIADALRTIARDAEVEIILAGPVMSQSKRITLHTSKLTAQRAFTEVLRGTNVQMFVRPDGSVVFSAGVEKKMGQGVIAGKITDVKSGKGISGATVSLDVDTRGVSTDENGSYRLTGISTGVHTVTVRLVGYAKQTRTVTVGEGSTVTVDFKLEPSTNVLDQVVVTGTVVQTELKAVPSAITVITAKQIEDRGITKIDQLFHGDIPGLFAQNQGSGALLDEVTMFSRGATALSGTSAGVNADFLTNVIKTYLDGVELADPKYLSQIDPKSIERIEILTGPQASTIYGSNAINGVMQIFTKRGTATRPQLTLNLMSGWVENNFSNARTPQHDYSAQVNGVEGRLSYNVGGSWNYIGPWTPAKQASRMNGFGGTRLDVPISDGHITTDVALRRSTTQTQQRGNPSQTSTGYRENGLYVTDNTTLGLSVPTTYAVVGQTLSLTLGYTPNSWWLHEFGFGRDGSDYQRRYTARGYISNSDTILRFEHNNTNRRTLRYTTTARLPLTSFAQATITAGADAWNNLTSSLVIQPQTLTGSLTNITSVTRQPGHNRGGFLQTQLGIQEQLFLTYGLRAEWNPNFGDNAQPNYAPRYGFAYTQELGSLTAKLRGSYGRSTRPPQIGYKIGLTAVEAFGSLWSALSPDYDNFDYQFSNPDLVPEYQQGGEGGVELYFGRRGSLVVTHYNQTVDGLTAYVLIDSVRSLLPNFPVISTSYDTDGYGYLQQYQYLNVGSIRNQGWELQGSINAGPLATRGTYSWTKSRTIGSTAQYRSYLATQGAQYLPGVTFNYFPEHTWAASITYTRVQTTVVLSMTGIGHVPVNATDELFFGSLDPRIRLPQNRLRVTTIPSGYTNLKSGYTVADLSASQRFISRVDGVLQIQNLMDHYKHDFYASRTSMGRQLKLGARVRL